MTLTRDLELAGLAARTGSGEQMTDVGDGARSVAVVGAGLIGLFSAHYLIDQGYQVALLDRDEKTGGGASRVNAGWVCPARSDPMPSWEVVGDGLRSLVSRDSGSFFLSPTALPRVAGYLMRFLRRSTNAAHARAWDELDTLSSQTAGLVDELVGRGVIQDLQDEGFLMLHSSWQEAEASRAALAAVSARGLSPAPEPLLTRQGLRELEPGLGPAAQWGFLHRGDRWLDPSRLVDMLTDSLIARGATVVTGAQVVSVRQAGDRVELDTLAGPVDAAHAVIAAGAWSEELLRRMGLRGFVTPGKGYSFTAYPEYPPKHVLRLGATHVGVTPVGETARLVGMMELDGTFDVLNRDRIDYMKRKAAPYLSGINWQACTDERVAPRPMTPDGKPLIGCVPGSERVVVATGHNMIGLSLAAVTGALVADLVRRGPAAGPPAFDPGRFHRRWRGVRR
jgi:D-amino-acid dehydrogenase